MSGQGHQELKNSQTLCYDAIGFSKLESADTEVLSESVIENVRIMLTNWFSIRPK